jgi:hypothetical protein
MTIIETVFVVSSVINVLLLLLVFYLVVNILHMKTYINQMHVGLGNIVGRIVGIEQSVMRLGVGFTDFIKTTEHMIDKMTDELHIGQIYRTSDGKFSAKSLDELINKIRQNGDETEYFSDDELNKLKNLFEQDDDSFDEDDED